MIDRGTALSGKQNTNYKYVLLDGQKLSSEHVVAVARGSMPVKLSPTGRERALLAHDAILKIAKRRPVYGQSTGVGF